MKPPKTLLEKAQENGSLERMNRILSAAHLLACVGNSLIEEANGLMKENNLLLGPLKKDYNNYVKGADRYLESFAGLVDTDKAKMDMFADMEEFEKWYRKWAKL